MSKKAKCPTKRPFPRWPIAIRRPSGAAPLNDKSRMSICALFYSVHNDSDYWTWPFWTLVFLEMALSLDLALIMNLAFLVMSFMLDLAILVSGFLDIWLSLRFCLLELGLLGHLVCYLNSIFPDFGLTRCTQISHKHKNYLINYSLVYRKFLGQEPIFSIDEKISGKRPTTYHYSLPR